MAVRTRVIVMVACVFVMAGIMTGVGVHLWQQHKDKEDREAVADKTLTLGGEINAYLTEERTKVYLVAKAVQAIGNSTELGSQVGIGAKGRAEPCTAGANSICISWEDGTKLTVTVSDKTADDPLDCVTMSWNVSTEQKNIGETPTDCYDMSKMYWYGAYEDHYQLWPINGFSMPAKPYVTGEVFERVEYGEVIEPLFVASGGFGLHVDKSSPLYLAINGRGPQPSICLKGRTATDSPFSRQGSPWLRYDLCRAKDISVLWKGMANKYLEKPTSSPSIDVVRKPIWSTWARYKAKIDEAKTLAFANEILSNNLSISQLEIDDDWTPHYGDFTFDTGKFPNATEMINNLSTDGIHTTVWMHPFINTDAQAYEDLSKKGYLVKAAGEDEPAPVDWWRGNNAGLIDFTNNEAVRWYLGQLKLLKTNFNVTSFKFDAGEVSYLPKNYALHTPLDSPNLFTTKYVQATWRADMSELRQEVRVGFRSQQYPVMVRMLDRRSDWGHELGLRTLIPTALAFGLAGYPFVLPDMVGGNAYNASNIDQTVFPEKELYIRWLQATLFLPVIQFSIAPWDYDDKNVLRITQEMLKIRNRHIDVLEKLWTDAGTTGEPIIRPLWWTDPTDQEALKCETEFLVGDDLLVAPILEEHAKSRDVYLPSGTWTDGNRDVTYQGSQWLRDVAADIDVLPHFIRFKRSAGIFPGIG